MTNSKTRRPLRTGGGAWGPLRVRLGISIRELERLSGVNRAALSYAETGRYNPRADEFEKVMSVLRERDPAAQTAGP